MNVHFRKVLKMGLLMLFATSSVSAARYELKNRDNSQGNTQIEKNRSAQDFRRIGDYNAPDQYGTHSTWNPFFSFDFLFWQNKVDGLSFGIVTNSLDSGVLSAEAPPQKGKVLNPDFGWHPGVRVTCGMNFDLDNWDALAEWTHMVSSSNTSVGIKTEDLNLKAILPVRIFSELTAVNSSKADHSFKNVLNTLDFNLGRPFYSGKDLMMRLHIGFRSSWIKNRENRTYEGLRNFLFESIGNLFRKARESSWGLGPRIGLDTNFVLGKGIRFFGNFSGSVQYVKYSTAIKGENSSRIIVSGQFVTGDLKNNTALSSLKTNLDSSMGFGWGHYFDNSNWRIDLSLAYDFNVWPSHYIENIFADADNAGVNITTYQDIIYHGGSLKLRLDF